MKSLITATILVLLAATSNATTISIGASITGTTTSSVKTSGSILVNNATNRGYAVFDLAAAGIPNAATITAVKLAFNYSISGAGSPICNVYGYAGDISSLSAAALYTSAVTSENLYTASWGTTAGTTTLSATTAADSFIAHNRNTTISATWVESASSRVYNITGGSNPQLIISYICNNPSNIIGSTDVCTAATTTLIDTTVGGTWSTSNAAIASVNATGNVTGISQGNAAISYTKGGCSVLQLMNVKTSPSAITGVSNICLGSASTLSNTAILGTWTSANPAVASINAATGVITSRTAGTTTITYSTGCGASVTKTENIITAPAAITGSSAICEFSTATLSTTTTDGTWSSSNTSVATISAAGNVHGRLQGNTTITYAVGSCITTMPVIVKSAPAAIVGTGTICNGVSTVITNSALAGTWVTGNATIASITTTGLLISTGIGSTLVSYNNGCGTAATLAVNVEPMPTALVGPSSVCSGYSTTFTEAIAGGTWSSSNSSIATVSPTGVVTGISAGSATISYTLTNSCGTNAAIQPLSVAQVGQWTGLADSSWTNAGNWACSIIPDMNTNVVIPTGTPYLPDFSATHFDVLSLTINNGVNITVKSGASINIYGNLFNNGSINGAGAVKMTGSSAENIFGKGLVNNLIIANTSSVTINSGDTVNIAGTLTLTSGTFNTNNGLKLLSTATGTAKIAPITGGTITGNVIIDQYFEGGRRAFRFFGHPFSTAIPLSMVGVKLDITGRGGATNGFTPTASNAASCFRYEPTTGNSALAYDPGWKAFTSANSTSDTNAFMQYEGIRLFVRGAKGEGLGYGSYIPSAATITMAGPVNTGTQTITLRKGSLSDYNQVSNPYPAPTNIGAVIAAAQTAGQVAGSAFFVWNPFLGAAGAYEAKFIGGSYVLDQNSSFQVRALNDSATLTFNENNKAADGDETLLRATPSQYITLGIYDANYHSWDKMYLSFNDDATINDDIKLDATKALNPDLNFYSYTGKTKFSVDARPYTKATAVPLGFTTGYTQQYIIKAENMVLPAGAALYLHDKLMNKYILLQTGTEYAFDVTTDKNTQGENRFELTSNDGTIIEQKAADLSVTISPNPATDNITVAYTTNASNNCTINVINVTGERIISKTITNNAGGKVNISVNELSAGTYMVEVISGTSKTVQKLIKE